MYVALSVELAYIQLRTDVSEWYLLVDGKTSAVLYIRHFEVFLKPINLCIAHVGSVEERAQEQKS